MRMISPLPLTGREVRDACLPTMNPGPVKDRILRDLSSIEAEEDALYDAASRRALRSLAPAQFMPVVSRDMKKFYENRLRDSAPGGRIWRAILDIGGLRCPFCHIAVPRTVEHSFPQSRYPRLTVEPLNLVPACRDCNFERNVGHGSITVSPYFDNWVADVPWLRAEVVDIAEPHDLRFYPERHRSFADDQWAALQQFVDDVDLARRYVDPAIQAFEGFAATLRLVDPHPTATVVKLALEDKIASSESAYGHNRWQTAAYHAWLGVADLVDWSTAGTPPPVVVHRAYPLAAPLSAIASRTPPRPQMNGVRFP